MSGFFHKLGGRLGESKVLGHMELHTLTAAHTCQATFYFSIMLAPHPPQGLVSRQQLRAALQPQRGPSAAARSLLRGQGWHKGCVVSCWPGS